MPVYYVDLHALTSSGDEAPKVLRSGPFVSRENAEEALVAALGSGKFASGKIVPVTEFVP